MKENESIIAALKQAKEHLEDYDPEAAVSALTRFLAGNCRNDIDEVLHTTRKAMEEAESGSVEKAEYLLDAAIFDLEHTGLMHPLTQHYIGLQPRDYTVITYNPAAGCVGLKHIRARSGVEAAAFVLEQTKAVNENSDVEIKFVFVGQHQDCK